MRRGGHQWPVSKLLVPTFNLHCFSPEETQLSAIFSPSTSVRCLRKILKKQMGTNGVSSLHSFGKWLQVHDPACKITTLAAPSISFQGQSPISYILLIASNSSWLRTRSQSRQPRRCPVEQRRPGSCQGFTPLPLTWKVNKKKATLGPNLQVPAAVPKDSLQSLCRAQSPESDHSGVCALRAATSGARHETCRGIVSPTGPRPPNWDGTGWDGRKIAGGSCFLKWSKSTKCRFALFISGCCRFQVKLLWIQNKIETPQDLYLWLFAAAKEPYRPQNKTWSLQQEVLGAQHHLLLSSCIWWAGSICQRHCGKTYRFNPWVLRQS